MDIATDPLKHCALCLQERELRSSHLLPAGAYRLAREQAAPNPNPVVIDRVGAVATSRQITAPLLCSECEQRFSTEGENYVLRECARPGGAFRLRDSLRAMQPAVCDGDVAVFEVHDANPVDIESLTYFAISIFWRAAARQWWLSGAWKRPTSLGPYGEPARRFLLGETSLPRDWRIFVHVWSEEHIDFTSTIPYSEHIEGTRRHKFCIPGITFIAFVGNRAATQFNTGAANGSDGRFVWLCPWRADNLHEGCGKLMLSAIRQRRGPG